MFLMLSDVFRFARNDCTDTWLKRNRNAQKRRNKIDVDPGSNTRLDGGGVSRHLRILLMASEMGGNKSAAIRKNKRQDNERYNWARPAAKYAARGDDVTRRHQHRVVRLLPLRHCSRRYFPKAFFPQDLPTMVLLIISFSTLAVGFLARPLGGIIFGHFGDRIGRKRTLVVALMMMGVATTLIGFLPTTHRSALRHRYYWLRSIIQGLAIGGQWGGAMLLVTESAPSDQRGWYGAYAQAGAPMGVILANLAFIGVSSSMSDEAFLEWGWRLPFIASIVLIGISMYIQLKIEDTEAFKNLSEAQAASDKPAEIVERSPVVEAIRKYPKRIMLAAGAFLSVQVTFYILIAFVIAYGVNSPDLNLSRDTMLMAVLVAAAIMVPTQFYFSGLSDRIGRKTSINGALSLPVHGALRCSH